MTDEKIETPKVNPIAEMKIRRGLFQISLDHQRALFAVFKY